ncbi:styrene monooxygenase/indole monooxygenase family protein [Acinetobacter boissieri]|uniref:2-polyprenyl-6-methoxyphenol hydroxylase n=1 Tax=Acinetobacter boissieri TaxID=1219383 RepID=A0A1G6HKW3_9GAMM|nr:styrene monooxygenase/indole monooxygenase family protein [Acinetobacter boissieri]SDB94824.1 2-polyprenyl-6-methoxyphenol hydroxylase [Acinetobacter boissieri]
MRRIAVIGAGQSGLQLSLGLINMGYEVTIFTNRTAEQIAQGRVMSSQCMFHTALQTERDLGLNFWEEACPSVEGIGFTIVNNEEKTKVFEWSARLKRYAQSVDQRVKMPQWMRAFEKQGGKIVIQDVGINELEQITPEYDLVLLAAGKGEVVKQFARDDEKSIFDKPQRALALTYVQGMKPILPYSKVTFNVIPGVGEYFSFPALSVNGPCDIMVFEGIPGGPMDCWQDVKTAEEHLEMSLSLLKQYVPWEYERCSDIQLTDDNGYLAGRFAPTIRQPILTLPSGRKVFGMADALVVNDPITGQGSNNAAKCSKIYFDAILAHADQDFSTEWMQDTFDQYWQYAEKVVAWTNSLLVPPEPHMIEILMEASRNQAIASEFANNFDDPRNFSPWWFDAESAKQFIKHRHIKHVA